MALPFAKVPYSPIKPGGVQRKRSLPGESPSAFDDKINSSNYNAAFSGSRRPGVCGLRS